jgi:uncharacterized FlgJ-related protein
MEEREILIARLRDVVSELAALEAALTDEAKVAHRDAVKEEFEDLLDRLNPTEAIPPPPPSDALSSEGLAIVVGHTARSQGAQALSPPFPADSPSTPLSERNEYSWNRDLALKIKKSADRAGIRCAIFFRDGVGIEGAYAAVRDWSPKATVELHFNAAEGNARGSLVLYGRDTSKNWATALQNGFVKLYDRQGRSEDRGVFIPGPDSPYKRGIASVTQLHPSALIEPFFGDNRSDATLAVQKKDGLADAILTAFASFVGIAAPDPVTCGNSGSTGGPGAIVLPPAVAAIPDVPLLRELVATYRAFTPTVPGLAPEVVTRLKSITLAQWIEETGWARSELAARHFNFAGMKAKSEVDAILREVPARKVQYLAHDGLDTYLEFGSIRDFIRGFFMFLERSPYRGWHAMAERSPHDFIRFIGRIWAQREGYASRVIGIERQLLAAGIIRPDGTLADSPTPPAEEGGVAEATASVSIAKVKAQGATADFLTLVDSASADPAFGGFQAVVIAQCALESDWGRSELARIHANFAGIPWSALFGEVAAAVPHPADPARGTFCRFLSTATFLRAYRHRLDNDTAFAGWRMASEPASLARFLGRTWRPGDAQYERKILDIVARIASDGRPTGGTAVRAGSRPQAGGSTASTVVAGVVLQIKRLRAEKRRGKGERTASVYQLFIDGRAVDGIGGMFLESRGPGDNSSTGVQLHTRIKEGRYPLLTHAGSRQVAGVTKFKTIGFTSSEVVGAPPMPSIRVGNTKSRTGILIHPGDGYLWSIGCLNPTKSLADANGNMVYADSRKRVIEILDAVRNALGDRFPTGNNEVIRDTTLEVIGEPGPAGTDALAVGTLSSQAFAQQQLAVADAALAEAGGDALAAPDLTAIYDALAAKMLAAALLGQEEDGAIDRIAEQGISLVDVRGATGETLWTPWALSLSAAGPSVAIVERLSAVASRLRDADVPLDDSAGAHTALVTAASGNDVAAIDALLDAGASIDFRDRSGLTPLLAAAFFGAPEAVASLLARGADPRAVVGASDALADVADGEFASPGDGTLASAAAGAALVADDPARLDDYERVTAFLWDALNSP